jgi:DNA-3-methyladenine glycosylase I
MNPQKRCAWAESDPLLRDYHDREWGRPVHDSRMLWEMLMLEGFQAGLSWLTILRKRDAFRQAFCGFDPEAVARFKEKDVQRLLGDEGIIRSRAKIEATIAGACIFLQMERDGGFGSAMWAHVGPQPVMNTSGQVFAKTPLSEVISADLRKRGFKFVGPVIVYAWMQAVGMVNDHTPECYLYRSLKWRSGAAPAKASS